MDRQKAEQLLEEAAEAQGEFWEKIRALEKELGKEISDSEDLANVTVDYLLNKEDDEE